MGRITTSLKRFVQPVNLGIAIQVESLTHRSKKARSKKGKRMQLAHERAFFKLSAAESGARPEYLLPPTALKANQRKHAARRGSEYCKPMSVLSSSCWPPKAAQAQSAYYGQQPGKERKSPRMRAVKRSERRGSNPRQPAWEAGTLPTELRSQVGDNVQANAVGCKR